MKAPPQKKNTVVSDKSQHIVKSKYILIGWHVCLVSVLETEEICHKTT